MSLATQIACQASCATTDRKCIQQARHDYVDGMTWSLAEMYGHGVYVYSVCDNLSLTPWFVSESLRRTLLKAHT